jgi:hypothetical protein
MQPLLREFDAQSHWAKIEPVQAEHYGASPLQQQQRELYEQDRSEQRAGIARRYPVKEFNQYRDALDPRRILSNTLVESLFDDPK